MKKLLAGLLSAAMVFTLAGCGSSKDHLATIQDKGEITIGLEGDWQPFSYHDKDDKLVGVDVEVAKNIAKKLGVKANIVEGKWDGLLTGLSTGASDPSTTNLMALAKLFGVTAEEILKEVK